MLTEPGSFALSAAHGLSSAPAFGLAIRFDLTDTYTFGVVAIVGVLLLGAYQADQSERRLLAAALIAASIAMLVGPLVILGILIAALWYAIFLGAPALGCVWLIRRLRRRRA